MMRRVLSLLIGFVVWAVAGSCAGAQPSVAAPTPDGVLGFTPGADRQLMDYEQLIDYLHLLAAASDRVELREVGSTPLGRTMYVAFISSAENIARLNELREINRRLALDSELEEAEISRLIANGRVFVMATLSMHSGEVAPSQSLPLLAHELATTTDPDVVEQLEKVVLMFVPCHNPDGMDMVVEHYRKYTGTPFEGSSLPGVYHKYVGHDNNRDFVALTQTDTRVISDLYSTEWYPQVLVEKHQMGSTGPRYYVPPNHDPIAQVIDEGLWNWSAVFGANLARDMTADGLQGVASHWLFDDYWPGSTETSHWKNVISFLTEAASCKTATPVFVEPTELRVRGKGLAEYEKGVNMLDPWPGGWWSLGDIVAYELSSMHSILATAARHRSAILDFRNRLCRKEVAKGHNEPPYYYVLPGKSQHDPSEVVALVQLLQRHGVRVSRLQDAVSVAGRQFAHGDFVVSLAQPYRPFIKEVMESQSYPERHYTPGGELIRPYDITSWSLPLHMGVTAVAVDSRSSRLEELVEELPRNWAPETTAVVDTAWGLVYPPTSNGSYRAAFTALGQGLEVDRVLAPSSSNGRTIAAGSFLIRLSDESSAELGEIAEGAGVEPLILEAPIEVQSRRLRSPRIALVETYFHDMDAGWTRFLFDSYGLSYRVLRPGDFESADLAGNFDVIVFPDESPDILTKGKYKRGDRYAINDFPPEFREPISKAGLAKLTNFIQKGGTVVAWGASTGLFTEGLAVSDDGESGGADTVEIPVRDISDELEGVLVPGAFLAVDFEAGHPLTWGLPAHGGAFSRGHPVFATSIPMLDTDRRVLGFYPKRDLLLSGYLEGEEELQNRAVVVWVRVGGGQLVLSGILPQFRGSTPVTYKLVFNALLLPEPRESMSPKQ